MAKPKKLPTGVRQRGDSYQKRFRYKDKDYSFTFTLDGEKPTYDNINQKAVLLTAEKKKKIDKNNNSYVMAKDRTLDEHAEIVFTNKLDTVKPTTVVRYRNYYKNHISPVLGSIKVVELEADQIEQFRADLIRSGKLELSTVNLVMRVLKIVLNNFVKKYRQLLPYSPADSLDALNMDNAEKATEGKHKALTEQEQLLFMKELRDSEEYYYEFIALMLLTGMRQGEVASLTPFDIDRNQKVIHVNKTITYDINSKPIIGKSPKTKASERDIPFRGNEEEVFKIVDNQLHKNRMIRTAEPTLFLTPSGKKVTDTQINRAIKKAVTRIRDRGEDIHDFTSHALRDTYATRKIEGGINPKHLQAIMGHTDIKLTLNLYAQAQPDKIQEEAEKAKIKIV